MRLDGRKVLPLCLFLSGGSALIYEIVWLRVVSTIMGSTVYATAAVITAFLLGLCLGSLAATWIAKRHHTPKTYAIIEVSVALTAALVPAALSGLQGAFSASYQAHGDSLLVHSLIQLALCGAAILIPTALMGATLPVLVGALSDDDHPVTATAGLLYGVNSLGAVFGAAACAWVLLPSLGNSMSIQVAVAINLVAAALAAPCAVAKSAAPSVAPEAQPPDELTDALSVGVLGGLYGLAGAASLMLQVGWARLVMLSVGSTVHGFAITLIAFIAGLALGSLVISRLRWLTQRPAPTLFGLHALIAAWTLLTLPYLGGLPTRIFEVVGEQRGFTETWLGQLGVVFSTIAVPTFAMGGIFALVTGAMHRGGASAARATGVAYAANTLGTIAGSLVAGFVLVPTLGMHETVVISAVVYAGVAAVYLVPSLDRSPAAAITAGGTFAILIAVSFVDAPRWSQDLLTSAPFLGEYQGAARARQGREASLGPVVDYVEGPTTAAAVRVRHGNKYLYVGGILEAGSHAPMHRFLAHLPMVLHGQARDVLVIGLGAGNTLGGVLAHPVDAVTCVELSEEVVQLARDHFAGTSNHALDDPRVTLTVGDGRNHLRHAGQAYDVIISQPSYPWMSGAASLFTLEAFTEMHDHLNDDGVAAIWFAAHSEATAQSMLRAWQQVFPESRLYAPGDGWDLYFAVGFKGPRGYDPTRVRAGLSPGPVRGALAPLGLASPAAFGDRLTRWSRTSSLATTVPVNTDDNGYVELRAFRALIGQSSR